LIPFTYSTLFNTVDRKLSKAPAPCVGWNKKSDEVRKVKGGKSFISLRCASIPTVS